MLVVDSSEETSLFLDFYGLREQPFGVTPDPRYFYPSASHRKTFESLIRGVQCQVGFALLIAEPGMGKTTLLYDLLKTYRASAETAFIFNTQCTSHEFLREVVQELGIKTDESDIVRLQADFKLFVSDRARKKQILLVIDEAQNLDDSVLETIRILSNFETPRRKLLHIILSGQPQLATNIRQPHLMQLMQRITLVDRLERLPFTEINAYIRHRLNVAGHDGSPLFSPEAVTRIDLHSGGIPRSINRLCFNALIRGANAGEKKISEGLIDQVAEALDLGLGTDLVRQEGDTSRAATSSQMEIIDKPPEPPVLPQPVKVQVASATPVPARQPVAVVPEQRQKAPKKPSAGSTSNLTVAFVSVALTLSVALVLSAQNGVAPSDIWLALANATNRGVKASATVMNQLRPEPGAENQAVRPEAPAATKTAGAEQPHTDIYVTRPAAPLNNLNKAIDRTTTSSITAPAFRNISSATSTVTVTAPSEPVLAVPGGSTERDIPSSMSTPLDRAPEPGPASTLRASSVPPRTVSPALHPPSGKSLRLVKWIRPVYPESARSAHIEGNVFLAVTVGQNGIVQDVHVHDGNPILASAAADAVRQWRYAPFFPGDSTSPSEVTVRVQFKFQ